jgi:hypothetical protein
MVTDRTTDGARPAIMANDNSEIRMRVSFISEPLRVLGIGLSKKANKSKIKPICRPETDKIWIAPAYW